jgi:cytochrome c oxidase assembly protein subunit 15
MRWLHRYATFVAASTVVLIAAGGMVTSTDSGLSLPDWPNTYGRFMFLYPLDRMVGGILYEHSHRMIASTVGMLTIVLAAWTWRVDPRRWVRRLAAAALGAVILQGLLGGLTVLLLLPAPVSIGHAGLAQIFFCLTVSLALFTSPGWAVPAGAADDDRLRRLAAGTTALVYLQILIGATMRHTGAGLAIPDVPLAFGRLLPPEWSAPIAIHFAHRIGALLVVAAVFTTAGRAWRHAERPELRRPALLLVLLVSVQAALGLTVVFTRLQPIVNTAHVVNGALVLATSLVLTLRSFRPLFDRTVASAAPRVAPAASPIGARS